MLFKPGGLTSVKRLLIAFAIVVIWPITPAYSAIQSEVGVNVFDGSAFNRVRSFWNTLSCDAVLVTGACTATDISTSPKSTHTWTVIVTGAPTAISVNLEGSLDGTNWFTLDNSTTTTSEMRHVVNKFVLRTRANVVTITGGAAPTVSVRIVSGD